MGVAQCREQTAEHLARHTDPSRVMDPATAEILTGMFKNIGAFCLPHPGLAIEDDTWNGSVTDISPDFIRMVDEYFRDVFQTNLAPKKILGSGLTPDTFDFVVKGYVCAFQDVALHATSFVQSMTNNPVLMAKAQSMRSYTTKMDRVLADNPSGLNEDSFNDRETSAVRQVGEEY